MKSVKSYVVDLFTRGQTHSYCFSLWLLRETLEIVPTYGHKNVYSLVDVKNIHFNTALMKMFGKVGKQNVKNV